MKHELKAICPKCGNEATATVETITDDDYIFFSCEDCGIEFTVHTEIEIFHTAPPEHDSVQDARD